MLLKKSLALLVPLVLASCGDRSDSGTQPDDAQVKSQIQQHAASASAPDARAALLAFADQGAVAQQRDFLAGRYSVPIPDSTEEQMGAVHCRPKGCRVTLICRPRGDNPCDTGDIVKDCDTPC